jgi:hypothetical protein
VGKLKHKGFVCLFDYPERWRDGIVAVRDDSAHHDINASILNCRSSINAKERMSRIAKPSILLQSLPNFVNHLRSQGISTFHAIYDSVTQRVIASHDFLQPIGDYFSQEGKDYNEHEGIFGQVNLSS